MDPRRPGGAAYIIFNEDMSLYKKASKGFLGTTNNRMELLAIISVVNSVPKNSEVTIFTDSQYSIIACKSNHLKKNKDLVELFHRLAGKLSEIRFEWVRGHAGNVYNEECDRMANAEFQKLR